MPSLSLAIAFGTRLLLVLLFLPFSALDKIVNFKGAVGQAKQAVHATAPAVVLILLGLTVEIGMSACILTGAFDRAAAFVMAGYCGVTALLWKQFWTPGDFWSGGKGRELFWDFLKNFALAGASCSSPSARGRVRWRVSSPTRSPPRTLTRSRRRAEPQPCGGTVAVIDGRPSNTAYHAAVAGRPSRHARSGKRKSR